MVFKDDGVERVRALVRRKNKTTSKPKKRRPKTKKRTSSKPKKRRTTSNKRVRKVKGKGLLGAIVRGTITAAKAGARAGIKLAKNANTWKKLAKAAVTQGASAAASEAVNKIVARQKRPKPDYYYR